MISQIKYVVAALQSKQSQHSHKNLSFGFLQELVSLIKKGLFNFLNLQICSGLNLYLVYACILKNYSLYMHI